MCTSHTRLLPAAAVGTEARTAELPAVTDRLDPWVVPTMATSSASPARSLLSTYSKETFSFRFT